MNVTRCKNCILPIDESITHGCVHANTDGTCQYCEAFQRKWRDRAPDTSKLDRVFDWAKDRAGDYHCLVPLSGGKDSCAVLDIVATRYPWARILAVTLDNGLLAAQALDNAIKITKRLRVDHVIWRPPKILDTMRVFLMKTGHFCAPCESAVLEMTVNLSARHRIPIVAMGNSSRLDPAHPSMANPWLPPFFDAVLKGENNEDRLRQGVCEKGLMVRLARQLLSTRFLLVPDLVDWNHKENKTRLAERYGLGFEHDHFDCLGSFVADWLYKRRCGFGQKTAALAAAVRNGLIPRTEALRRLESQDEFGRDFPVDAAQPFLERLGLSVEDVVSAAERSPKPYMGL